MAKNNKSMQGGGPASGIYLMGMIGSLVYFINRADGIGEVALSFLQALVWPALLIHRVFQMLQI